MMPPCVKKGVADDPIGPTVLATCTFLTYGEQQTILQADEEMRVRHDFASLARWAEERASAWAPMGPGIGRVTLRESPEKSLPPARADLLSPSALKFGNRLVKHLDPIQSPAPIAP